MQVKTLQTLTQAHRYQQVRMYLSIPLDQGHLEEVTPLHSTFQLQFCSRQQFLQKLISKTTYKVILRPMHKEMFCAEKMTVTGRSSETYL